MRRLLLLFFVAPIAACDKPKSAATPRTIPPPARTEAAAPAIPAQKTRHGRMISDDYLWMRRKSDAVRQYVEAENRLAERVLTPLRKLENRVYRELYKRHYRSSRTLPAPWKGYYYYSRWEPNEQHEIRSRRKGSMDADVEDMLDVNELAWHGYADLRFFQVADDHERAAYAIDRDGDEVGNMRFLDLRTGHHSWETVRRTYWCQWAGDGRTVVYSKCDDVGRPDRIYRHRVGTSPDKDVLMLRTTDPRIRLTVGKTRDGKYLLLGESRDTTKQTWTLDAGNPTGKPRLLLAAKEDVEYGVGHSSGRFFVCINDTGRNFRVISAPEKDPVAWTEVVPHDDARTIESMKVYANHLVLQERTDGVASLRVIDLRSGKQHGITIKARLHDIDLEYAPEFDTNLVRFSWSTLIDSGPTFDYDMDTRKRKDISGRAKDHDPKEYWLKRIHAVSRDGSSVPITLAGKKGAPRRAPTLLYAYGSYARVSGAAFDRDLLPLLERGVTYAVAHVRGGGFLGRASHFSTRGTGKEKTIDDFLACAEHLVKEGYTDADRLAIEGISAGGTLIGAAINRRPELFRVALAKVPFVDLLETMWHGNPRAAWSFAEWGNPRERHFFDAMSRYAPYENVRAQAYPALYVTAGWNDGRVPFWEPARWVARLRALRTNERPIVFRTDMHAGHFGASGRYRVMRETARGLAFLLHELGYRR